MGTYFNPPDHLPLVARRVEGETYSQLVGQLESGERLFGHYDRGHFQNAVWLCSPEEFNTFEEQVFSGIVIRLGFYAMTDETFKAHGLRG